MTLRHLLPEGIPFAQDGEEDRAFTDLITQFQSETRPDLERLIETEQNSLNVDESVRNQIHLTPEEISELTDEVINSSEFDTTFDIISSSEIESIADSSDPFEEYIEALDSVCEDCVKHKKVLRLSQVKAGDHIRFHRKKAGFNLYNHHAVVTAVQLDVLNPRVGKLNVVHFTPTEDGTKKIIKETIPVDVGTDDIDIIQYPNRPFTTEQIITRANEMAEKYERNPESYHLIRNNCEHRANEIASGNRFSNQVTSGLHYVKSTISWLLKFLLKIGIRIFTSMKTLIRGFAHVAVIGSLLAMVDQIASLKEKLKKGLICLKCYEKQHTKLMVSLVFCLITVGISVMCHVGWLYFSISTVVAVALPFLSSFFIDKVTTLIHPASKIPKPLVRRGNMIHAGDVITFPYIGLSHEGVVTKVGPHNPDQRQMVKVTVVHYNYPGLFGTRTVVKEDMFFNLEKENVYKYDFSQQQTYSPDEVVQRAKEKVGEQKFNTFWNRSSHMCRLCKTGRSDLTDLPYQKATSRMDLTPGDIIDFTYCNLAHQGVVIKVEYSESIKCDVVHYNYAGLWGTRSVVEETFIFNLSEQNLHVHDYNGQEVYEAEEVVRRAKSRKGEQKFNTFTNRSSHLAKWCKMK